jgi:two-component system sensor histidine kinase HydH
MSAAGRICDGVRGLERLVTEILEFAQGRATERQSMALGSALEAVATSIAPWETQCGGKYVVDDSARGVEVWADRDQLVQVMLNLVMNGLQAAGDHGSVTLSAAPRDGGVEIEVSDDGPGIAEADLTRIFNPFFTTRATGTGLGLPIVHRIVEAHGGRIRASNRDGGGARFRVWLPGRDAVGQQGRSVPADLAAPRRRRGDESTWNETMAKAGVGVDRRADAPKNRRSAT